MKSQVTEILKSYPIAHELGGWFFRVETLTPDHWRAIGVDLDGRKVVSEGRDADVLLACISQAKHVSEKKK